MKKISIMILLSLLFLGCSREWNLENKEVIENEKPVIETRDELINEENNFEIVEILNVSCIADNECETPAHYLIQSHCPYSSKCIESKCSVICPSPFIGKKIEGDIIPAIDK